MFFSSNSYSHHTFLCSSVPKQKKTSFVVKMFISKNTTSRLAEIDLLYLVYLYLYRSGKTRRKEEEKFENGTHRASARPTFR